MMMNQPTPMRWPGDFPGKHDHYPQPNKGGV